MIFRNWVLQNFPFLEDDFDALTDYELFCKMVEYMKESLEHIKSYDSQFVDFNNRLTTMENYFDNLDVQEEINNKLDEMAESGELTDIIAQYLGLAGMITFNNVSEMKLAENLVNGSKCATLGYYNVNDGGNSFYKIRNITNEDVVDESSIIALYNENLVAELIITNGVVNLKQFGCYGDGTHNDTTKFQNALTFVRSNNYKLSGAKNDVYLVTESLNVSNLYLDLNLATIKTTAEIDILTINSTTYYTTLKNINIDCNNVATSGLCITNARKGTFEDINILKVKNYGIKYLTGYEMIMNCIHITGDSSATNPIGIYNTSGDSYFNNIVIIDCKIAIQNVNGFNYFNNIHAWILTPALLPNSIYLKCSGGKIILTDCYCDTYQYSIYEYDYIPRLMIKGFSNVYNTGIYTEEIATANRPTFMYCANSSGNALTRISNSWLSGYSASIKTYLTNLSSFDGDIVDCLIDNFDKNIPFSQIGTTNNTAGVTVVSSSIEKTNKCVYVSEIATVDATETKTFTIGNIGWYYRPHENYNGMACYGGVYTVTGACYLYIGTNGNIVVTLPDSATGTQSIKVNVSFITHVES